KRYGTIRMHQDREGRQPVATDLGPVDFAAIARGLGADGVTVERDDEVEAAIAGALESKRTTVIHLALDPRWVSVDEPAIDASSVPQDPAAASDSDIASAS
ncbi:MAG: thiamine pyrophosphate-dependent enzyme, partial [Candidatus Limnocylindrales bacterium]